MGGMREECESFVTWLYLFCFYVLPYIIALIVAVFGCSKANAASDPAIEAGFIPHKALYDIRLTSKKSGTIISNLSGKMMYEWHSACDGWVSDYQFDMLYEYVEIPAARVTSDISTYESFDGKNFNFTVQRKKDGYPFEQFRGATTDGEDGYPNNVAYSVPENLVQALPKGTLFPMNHTLGVLKNIRQGKRFYNATLFDGSDGEGPVDVNTFIGKEYAYQLPKQAIDDSEDPKDENIDPALLNTKAWDIRLAFFPQNTSDFVADYEMSVVFHENGIISKMEIEYEDFSIIQNLIAIEPMELGCEDASSNGEDDEKVDE